MVYSITFVSKYADETMRCGRPQERLKAKSVHIASLLARAQRVSFHSRMQAFACNESLELHGNHLRNESEKERERNYSGDSATRSIPFLSSNLFSLTHPLSKGNLWWFDGEEKICWDINIYFSVLFRMVLSIVLHTICATNGSSAEWQAKWWSSQLCNKWNCAMGWHSSK